MQQPRSTFIEVHAAAVVYYYTTCGIDAGQIRIVITVVIYWPEYNVLMNIAFQLVRLQQLSLIICVYCDFSLTAEPAVTEYAMR